MTIQNTCFNPLVHFAQRIIIKNNFYDNITSLHMAPEVLRPTSFMLPIPCTFYICEQIRFILAEPHERENRLYLEVLSMCEDLSHLA